MRSSGASIGAPSSSPTVPAVENTTTPTATAGKKMRSNDRRRGQLPVLGFGGKLESGLGKERDHSPFQPGDPRECEREGAVVLLGKVPGEEDGDDQAGGEGQCLGSGNDERPTRESGFRAPRSGGFGIGPRGQGFRLLAGTARTDR
jgi:hypothetical protein